MHKKVKMFEVFPGTGISCAEQGDIPSSEACAKYITSEPRFTRDFTSSKVISAQALRDKLAKGNSWLVVKSGYDAVLKQFWFEHLVNAQDTEVAKLSYGDVCKDMHWKSWKFINSKLDISYAEDISWMKPLIPEK